MTTISVLPVLQDNYAYLIEDGETGKVAVVDPSEANPVIEALEKRGKKLSAILNTHHHTDHVGGNSALQVKYRCPVIASAYDAERIPGWSEEIGESLPYQLGSTRIEALRVPGHTLGAVAFYLPQDSHLFTGDTLFSMGCGRLFEGTPQQMFQSLLKFVALPRETRIYCGHEYTHTNAKFALRVEPDSEPIRARLNAPPEVPTTLALELETNPFLRARNVSEFAQRRAAKDRF